MIGNSWRLDSFTDLARYLEHGRSGAETGRVERWEPRNVAAGNLADAAEEMAREARLNDVVQQPVYHLEISFPPSEPVETDTIFFVADSLLESLRQDLHAAAYRVRAAAAAPGPPLTNQIRLIYSAP